MPESHRRRGQPQIQANADEETVALLRKVVAAGVDLVCAFIDFANDEPEARATCHHAGQVLVDEIVAFAELPE